MKHTITTCDRCCIVTSGICVRNAHDFTGCGPIDPTTMQRPAGHDFCPRLCGEVVVADVRPADAVWLERLGRTDDGGGDDIDDSTDVNGLLVAHRRQRAGNAPFIPSSTPTASTLPQPTVAGPHRQTRAAAPALPSLPAAPVPTRPPG